MSTSKPLSYIAQAHPRQEGRKFELKTKTVAFLVILFLLASLIGWFYLTQASEATTTALRLERLALERERLRRENAELRYQMAELENLSRLREGAQILSFQPPQEEVYLYTYTSEERVIPAPRLEASSPPPEVRSGISKFWRLCPQSPEVYRLYTPNEGVEDEMEIVVNHGSGSAPGFP